MAKICILQTENRINLDYFLLSQKVNKKVCNYFGYKYKFIYLNHNKYNIDPKTAKLYIVHEYLRNSTSDDVLIFLDSDAWVENSIYLKEIIDNLLNDNNKHGCFSRDPYTKNNTFINSGSFIIKINDFTRKMYGEIINELKNDIKINNFNKYGWEDQFYISNYVYKNKDKFNIFIPPVLNTPMGIVLRHNWTKNKKMYDDLYRRINDKLVINNTPFDFNNYFDTNDFPNK